MRPSCGLPPHNSSVREESHRALFSGTPPATARSPPGVHDMVRYGREARRSDNCAAASADAKGEALAHACRAARPGRLSAGAHREAPPRLPGKELGARTELAA